MKKWGIAFFALVIIIIVVASFVIGPSVQINRKIIIHVNTQAFMRTIQDDGVRDRWWPLKIPYTVLDRKLSSLIFSVQMKNINMKVEMTYIPLNSDSVIINANTSTISTSNFLTRIINYYNAKKNKSILDSILYNTRLFYSSEDNIYSIHIEKSHVLDSMLVFTSFSSDTFPGMYKIYEKINLLKNYVLKNNASVTGFPMLNIFTPDSTKYLTRVALPVNKKLMDSADFHYRWMLGGGNILFAEVKGGYTMINRAFRELENYIHDHNRTPPAISFQALITNRQEHPDSNEWITRVYWPVM